MAFKARVIWSQETPPHPHHSCLCATPANPGGPPGSPPQPLGRNASHVPCAPRAYPWRGVPAYRGFWWMRVRGRMRVGGSVLEIHAPLEGTGPHTGGMECVSSHPLASNKQPQVEPNVDDGANIIIGAHFSLEPQANAGRAACGFPPRSDLGRPRPAPSLELVALPLFRCRLQPTGRERMWRRY